MSWSDDIRCLYCDGKLPAYRKIASGQFCSGAHQKAYWKKQEQLAVERLSQTAESLAAALPEEPVVPAVSAPGPRAKRVEPIVAAAPAKRTRHAEPIAPALAEFDLAQGELAKAASYPMTADMVMRRVPLEVLVPESLDVALPSVPRRSDASLQENSLPEASLQAKAHQDKVPDLTQAHLALPVKFGCPVTADRLVMQRVPLEALVPKSLDVALPSVPRRPDASLQENSLQDASLQATSLQAKAHQDKVPHLTQAHLALPVKFGCSVTADRLVMQRVPLEALVPKSLDVALPSAPRRPDTSLQENVPELMQAGLLGLSINFGASVTADPLVMRRVPLEVLVPESLEVLLPSASYRPDALLQDQDQLLQERLPDLTHAELFALPVTFGSPAALAEGGPATGVIAIYPNSADPALPKSGLIPVDGTMSPVPPVSLSAYANLVPQDPAQTRDIWQQAADFWKHAPRDLKLALFAIPVLVGMAFHPRLPKVHVAAPAANIRVQANTNFQQVLAKPLDAVQQNLASRAAVALIEDFRFGMDDWQMHSDLSTPWSFDSNGFVRPGSLALYRPSMHLTDYEMQFVGLIDKKALSFVVRAQDFENYYVVKLHVIKPGRLPLIGVTRYAVINGKAQHRGDAVVSVMAVPDTIFHVNVTVHDDTFLLSLQGKVADSWTEPALTQGGIGFFSASGEESRIRWLQLTHQYDMLGRLCAFLAPYNVSN